MNVSVKPGKYVVAVSGGVDSVVLLNVLSKVGNLELVVAHFDHGIRAFSHKDAKFVASLARQYSLPFETVRENLGEHASEALARSRRYAFLKSVQQKYCASAIITAHHQDDYIETAIINMLRGSKHKGMYALGSRPDVLRPLLNKTKQEIIDYARENNLRWREDETNMLDIYLRNKIRKIISKKISPEIRQAIMKRLHELESIGDEIDTLAREILTRAVTDDGLDRSSFIAMTHKVACEIMAAYLRQHNVSFDEKTIERVVVECKTKQRGKRIEVQGGAQIYIDGKLIRMQLISSV